MKNKRDKSWQKLEDYIASRLKEIDSRCRPSKASGGNCSESGDIFFSKNVGLHLEAKDRDLKSVYNEEWLTKCESEIPLHGNKIAVLVTRNNEGKMRVHLDADDFLNLYIDYYKLKNGDNNE